MQLNIADNFKIKINNNIKEIIYVDGNLQDNNSLKYLIEKDKKKIRSEISKIIKVRLSNKFKYFFRENEDFLIWKMSSIFEINTLRTNSFYKLAQLICLKKIIKKKKIKIINYYGSDKNILDFLLKAKVKLNYYNIKASNYKINRFHFLRGLVFFFKYVSINFFLIFKNFQVRKSENNLIFLSYLVHLNKNKKKYFASNHWGDLPETVNETGNKIDWYYDYSPSHELINLKRAKIFLNKYSGDPNSHNFLAEYLTISSCLNIFFKFIIVTIKFNFTNKKKKFEIPELFKLNLYNIFKNELQESFNGTLLISNLFYIEIYRNFFREKKNIRSIFFLLENQPWEKAFLYFSNSQKNLKIYGCVNSTTIFWDMRYFHHNKYENFKMIDNILINGALAKNYLKSCVVTNKIKEVEAVRYKYLLNYKKKIHKKNKKILILGEQSIPTTLSCLHYLNSSKNDKNYKFDFKPHPTTASKVLKLIEKNYPKINLLKSKSRDIYKHYKYTIVIGSTSAIIEAIYFKTKILIYDKLDNFFLCPLFNEKKASVIDENKTISKNLENNLLKIRGDELSNVANIKYKNKSWSYFIRNL